MRQKLPNHLSHNYKLNVETTPTKCADRLSLAVVMPAIFLGLVMVFIGIFEMSNGMYLSGSWVNQMPESNIREPLFSPMFVDISFIVIGICIILASIIAHIRYKKIFFNGRIFSVDFRGLFGDVEMFRENLRNYRGVRLRVEFSQWGITARNKYIIELEHIDPQKTIPLYISTNTNGVYDFWYYYAKMLNKPALIETDEGSVLKGVYDLDKTLREYLNDSGLLGVYEEPLNPPKCIECTKSSDKMVIKPAGTSWDALSIIGAFWLTFLALILALAFSQHHRLTVMAGSVLKVDFALAIATIVLALLMMALFKKDKLVIKENRLILVHKFMLISRKADETKLSDIQDIQVVYNPYNERYYLSIVSSNRIIAFGRKMPIECLQWVRDFIIYEIMK